MELQALVFHKLETHQHSKLVVPTPRPQPITLPDERADLLVEGMLKGYRNEGAQAYATFASSSQFKEKLYDLSQDNLDFYRFSTLALDQLTQILSRTPAATGGYLTFAQYMRNDEQYFMVVLIKDKEGIGITETLDLEDVQTLDLDKLHFAARVNVTEWLRTINDRKNHVSFLKGKGRSDEVVDYFKQFVGIDDNSYQDPVRHTKALVMEIKNFCTVEYEGEAAVSRRRSIQEYTEDKESRSQPINLTEISNMISPDDPNKFLEFLEFKNVSIPGEFRANAKQLKRLTKYQFKGEVADYSISFEQTAVEDRYIWLNSSGNLEISDVPESIKIQLIER